ncbi:hypothetical protein BLKGLAD_18680 [Burkholderia gladioli pv. gladioli]
MISSPGATFTGSVWVVVPAVQQFQLAMVQVWSPKPFQPSTGCRIDCTVGSCSRPGKKNTVWFCASPGTEGTFQVARRRPTLLPLL